MVTSLPGDESGKLVYLHTIAFFFRLELMLAPKQHSKVVATYKKFFLRMREGEEKEEPN